jgi:cytochrome c oxidase subunit IV
MHDSLAAHADGSPTVSHVLSPGILLGVFVCLIGLTAITVAVTWVDLGPWNLIVAMAIATVKAALVALYFMHLRYDHPFNAMVFVAGLGFLAIFVILTLMDATAYQPDVERYRDANPTAVSQATLPPTPSA